MTASTTEAATAASERARTMPLTPVDPPAAVIRALEDAALPRIDAETARRFVDLDRRFDRTVSALRQELARRQERVADDPARQPASGWDMTGFLLSLAAAPLLLSAGGVAGDALPTPVVVAVSAGLVVAAAVAHAIGAMRGRRAGTSVASSRPLVLLSAIVSLAVAGLILWRTAGHVTPGVLVAFGLAALSSAVCIVLFVPSSREARADAAARRVEREAEGGRRADLEIELVAAIEAARAESWALLGGLTAAQRDELDSATTQAVSALARRQLLEPAVLKQLRTSGSGQLRYAVGL